MISKKVICADHFILSVAVLAVGMGILSGHNAEAGGAVAARRNVQPKMMAERQAMMQQQAVQQMMAQRQAMMQQQAMQHAVVQGQAALEGQAIQQAQAMAQQRAVMEYQAMQQAQMAAHVAAQAALQQPSTQQALIQQMLPQGGNLTVHVPTPPPQDITVTEQIDESQVRDIVNIEDLWTSFEKDSQAWPLIMEMKAKILTVSKYVDHYRVQGITIAKPPIYYAQMIDGMSQENPALLAQPFPSLLQFCAIMEYDFSNGVDKDLMAKKLLGEQGWQANRRRLGMP